MEEEEDRLGGPSLNMGVDRVRFIRALALGAVGVLAGSIEEEEESSASLADTSVSSSVFGTRFRRRLRLESLSEVEVAV